METCLAGGMWEPHHSGKEGWLYCSNGLWLCPGVQALFVAGVYRGQPLSGGLLLFLTSTCGSLVSETHNEPLIFSGAPTSPFFYLEG